MPQIYDQRFWTEDRLRLFACIWFDKTSSSVFDPSFTDCIKQICKQFNHKSSDNDVVSMIKYVNNVFSSYTKDLDIVFGYLSANNKTFPPVSKLELKNLFKEFRNSNYSLINTDMETIILMYRILNTMVYKASNNYFAEQTDFYKDYSDLMAKELFAYKNKMSANCVYASLSYSNCIVIQIW